MIPDISHIACYITKKKKPSRTKEKRGNISLCPLLQKTARCREREREREIYMKKEMQNRFREKEETKQTTRIKK